MFSDIINQSTLRLIEVRELLDSIRNETPTPPNIEPNKLLISKGLFFVHLYGAYEYTVKTTVSKAIYLINQKRAKINDCKPLFLSIILNSDLDAIALVGDKKWEKRHLLFSNFDDNNSVQIQENIFPTNGRNLKYRQLQSIWNSFSIKEPVLPRPELRGRITELILNRNAIAHGNSSAVEIGSKNTIAELYIRHSEISEVCTHILQVFEEYITKERFLKEEK